MFVTLTKRYSETESRFWFLVSVSGSIRERQNRRCKPKPETDFMFRGFRSIFYKEVIQISRDPLTLALMLLVPMIQLMVFGYAINTDVRDIKTAVYNLDPGPQSRELLQAFENTDYFQIVRYVGSDEELNNSIVTGSVKVGIKIPPDYSDRLLANRQATVLVLIDGSDSSIATQSLQVASQVGLTESLERLSTELRRSPGGTSQLPIEIRPKMLFNPDSRSANFMVPGLDRSNPSDHHDAADGFFNRSRTRARHARAIAGNAGAPVWADAGKARAVWAHRYRRDSHGVDRHAFGL